MPWNCAIGLPELLARRSRTAAPASNAPSAIPSDSAAMPMRPESSVRMKFTKPCALVAEQVLRRDLDVLDDQLARVRRAPAELVFLLAGAEARHRGRATARGRRRRRARLPRSFVCFVRMNELMPFVPCDGIGHRGDDEDLADAAVRDEPLRRR